MYGHIIISVTNKLCDRLSQQKPNLLAQLKQIIHSAISAVSKEWTTTVSALCDV